MYIFDDVAADNPLEEQAQHDDYMLLMPQHDDATQEEIKAAEQERKERARARQLDEVEHRWQSVDNELEL